MNRSITHSLRTLAIAASATAVVAIAGPAQASSAAIYVNGFGSPHYNSACIGSWVDIVGYGLPAKAKTVEVTEVTALLVIKKVSVSSGEFTATIDSNGERGRVPYHLYAYDKNRNVKLTKTVTINWVRCVEPI